MSGPRGVKWTWATAWLLLLLCLLPLGVMATVAVPALDDPVVDSAHALSADTRNTLRTQALQLQARTGAQLQVLVVDHVGEEGIEAYAQRVFEQWQLGRDGVDDGVLLLVAVQDRRVRIQTGYGLEGAIPDAYAARIIDKAIVPRFREGDLDQGLLEGTNVLVALIDGESLPEWEEPSARNVLPPDWRSADSVVALTLLAGFLAGLWRSPSTRPAAKTADDFARRHHQRRRGTSRAATPAQARAKRLPAWGRPMLVTAVVAMGMLAAALWAPRAALAALCFVLALCVPVASLLGWCWRRSGQPGPAHSAGPGRGHCRDAGVFPRTGRSRALAQGSPQLRTSVRSVVAAERWLRTLRTAGHRTGRAGCTSCGNNRLECGHAAAVLRVDLHLAAG